MKKVSIKRTETSLFKKKLNSYIEGDIVKYRLLYFIWSSQKLVILDFEEK